LRLLEQIPDPGRADANEHLDELRAADGQKRHGRLSSDRLRQKSLACARRTDNQYTLGYLSTELAVALRIAQKVDNFFQFQLGFVNTGYIREAHPGLLLHE